MDFGLAFVLWVVFGPGLFWLGYYSFELEFSDV